MYTSRSCERDVHDIYLGCYITPCDVCCSLFFLFFFFFFAEFLCEAVYLSVDPYMRLITGMSVLILISVGYQYL